MAAADTRPRWALTDAVVAVLVVGILAFVGFELLRRGANLSDEGFLLLEALDMRDGKVLYRDIEAFVAPGVWFLVAGLFALVEPSFLASRWIAAASYFALPWVIFRLVRRGAALRPAVAAVACYAVLAVWSFPHWTWAWYSPWSILFALLALDAVWRFEEEDGPPRWMAAGLWVGLAALFKQNYGFFALVAVGLSALALRWDRRETPGELLRGSVGDGLRLGAGLGLALLPFLAYFAWHGALWTVFDRFVLYPLEFTTDARIPYLPLSSLWSHEVFAQRITSTNYLSELVLHTPAALPGLPGPGTIRSLHAGLYWAPPLLLGLGLLLSLMPREVGRRLDLPLFASTAMSGLLFLGVFPRADFTHLVTVYQPLLVTGALVWHRLAARVVTPPPLWAWVPVSIAVSIFVLYGVAAGAWLVYLRATLITPLPQARGGVLVHPITEIGIRQLVDVVQAKTEPGDAFIGIPDMAGINFLAERRVPGSQYQTYAHMIGRDRGELTTRQIDEAGVPFVVARYDNVLSTEPRLATYAPVLADYLARHFHSTWLIQNDQYLLLERREVPLAPGLERISVLEDCRPETETDTTQPAAPASVRHHLLFSSLFQPLAPDAGGQLARTRCRVAIPPGARLSLRLGYKRPVQMEQGSRLDAQVWMETSTGAVPLLREQFAVEPAPVDGIRVPPRHLVDLSAHAGQEVELVFQVARLGRVRLSPFTIETFGLYFQDPVLEVGWRP